MIIRAPSAVRTIRDGKGGTTYENNSLLRDGNERKEVLYEMKFQDGDLESQKTKPR